MLVFIPLGGIAIILIGSFIWLRIEEKKCKGYKKKK